MRDMYPLVLAAHAHMSVASVVRMSLPVCSLTIIKLRQTIISAQVLLAVGSSA